MFDEALSPGSISSNATASDKIQQGVSGVSQNVSNKHLGKKCFMLHALQYANEAKSTIPIPRKAAFMMSKLTFNSAPSQAKCIFSCVSMVVNVALLGAARDKQLQPGRERGGRRFNWHPKHAASAPQTSGRLYRTGPYQG